MKITSFTSLSRDLNPTNITFLFRGKTSKHISNMLHRTAHLKRDILVPGILHTLIFSCGIIFNRGAATFDSVKNIYRFITTFHSAEVSAT